MEAVQIGFRDGLEAAIARLNCAEHHPLTWEQVRRELLDYQTRDPVLDG